MILWTLRILGPFAFFACAAAQKPTNHTIDDKDPMVIVYGQCDLYNSTLDYRGSHIIGTGDDSRVVFTFEGTSYLKRFHMCHIDIKVKLRRWGISFRPYATDPS